MSNPCKRHPNGRTTLTMFDGVERLACYDCGVELVDGWKPDDIPCAECGDAVGDGSPAHCDLCYRAISARLSDLETRYEDLLVRALSAEVE